ncbi:MAG: hypothetical protein PHQ65_16325, partial [Bacteroidales bacterium]|nr:hypothetical protein [Bacteroidales bacterium]
MQFIREVFMKIRGILAVLSVSSALLAAEPRQTPPPQRIAPPIIRSGESAVELKVASTGSWSETETPGISNRADTPPGMLAAKLAEEHMLCRWMPSPDSASAIRGADLIDAVLSADESLLIIAERIGGAGKPNSARLVFLNLFNGKIIGGFELSRRRIASIALIPGQPEKLLAVQTAQPEFGSADALLVIDLRRKKIAAESEATPGRVRSVATDGEQLWFTAAKEPGYVLTLPLASPRGTPERIRCKTAAPRIL